MGLPKLGDLVDKCLEWGVNPTTHYGHYPSKAECVSLLRMIHMPAKGLPYTELTPMLCFPMWKMHSHEQDACWDGPGWIAQEKLNGVRVICHFVAGKGIFLHTRTISVQTWRYAEVSQQFLFHDYVPDFSCTLDCEAIIDKPIDTRGYTGGGGITKSALASTVAALHIEAPESRRMQQMQEAPLRLQVFDIPIWKGRNICGMPLHERLKALNHFKNISLGMLGSRNIGYYFEFPDYVGGNRRDFARQVIRKGGEGVILKNFNSPYIDSSSRRRDGWIKTKRRIEFDAFVTGFKQGEPGTEWENMVGSLEFSVYLEEGKFGDPITHVIGYVAAMSMEERQQATRWNENGLSLNPELYGRVAEVSGQDISARELRLTHCILEKWRVGVDYKNKIQCVEDLGMLERMAHWVK